MSDDNYGEDVARHEWYMTKVSGFRVRKYEDDKTLGLQYKTSWHDSTGATWVDELNTGTDDSGLVRRYIRANKATILRVILGFMDAPANNGFPFVSNYCIVANRSLKLINEAAPDVAEDDILADSDVDPDIEPDDGLDHLTVVPYYTKLVKGLDSFECALQFSRNGITVLPRIEIAAIFGFVICYSYSAVSR